MQPTTHPHRHSLAILARLGLILALLIVLLAQSAAPAGATAATGDAAPLALLTAALLNADGTLNTRTGASGALDVRGWNVTLDAARGPVLTRAASAPSAPLATSRWWPVGYPGPASTVYAIAVSGTDVYVGGNFTSAGGVAANYIAKWNGTTWSALGTGTDGIVRAIAVNSTGDVVYAGGLISRAGSCTTFCRGIAKWSTTTNTWSALDSSGGVSSNVFALALSGTDLYVGGPFTFAGSCTSAAGCRNIAKFSTTTNTYSALGTGMNNTVYAIAVSSSGDVYAGGDFTDTRVASCSNCKYIAKYSGGAWSALGTGVASGGAGYNVDALAVIGSDVYAGGGFASAGGVANTQYVARWNGSAWSAMGTGISQLVYAMAVNGGNLYVAGNFNSAGGVAYTKSIARWNGTAWESITTAGGSSGNLYAIGFRGGEVYVGGLGGMGTCICGCGNLARLSTDPPICNAIASGDWRSCVWDCGTYPGKLFPSYNGGVNPGGETVNIGSGMTITLGATTYDDPFDLNDVNIDGTLTNDGGARTLSLAGNWTNNSTFAPGTSIGVTCQGTGAQTIGGSAATTFYNLTTNAGSNVSLGQNATVNGTLTLNSDLNTTASYVLTLGANTASVAGAEEVIGTVHRASPGTGSALAFNNVSTTFNFATAPTQMDVQLTRSAHPNANAAMLARTYTLTPTGGVNATVCLGYKDSELGTLTEANLRLCRWDTGAGQWNCPARAAGSSTTNNTVCADNVTQFSDWTLGAVGPTAVTLSSFHAAAPTFDLAAWFADLLRQWRR